MRLSLRAYFRALQSWHRLSGRREQQPFVRTEPQGGAVARDLGAACNRWKRDAETPVRRLARGWPALEYEARGGTPVRIASSLLCMEPRAFHVVKHRLRDGHFDVAPGHRNQSVSPTRARPPATIASAIGWPSEALAYEDVTWSDELHRSLLPRRRDDLRALFEQRSVPRQEADELLAIRRFHGRALERALADEIRLLAPIAQVRPASSASPCRPCPGRR
jgi:hypothetical protein